MAAIAFSLVIALSQQTATQAAPEVSRPVPQSLLPTSVGVALRSNEAVRVTFDAPMDPASVEAALQLQPMQDVTMRWNQARTVLAIQPDGLWQTDAAYLIVIGETATTAGGDPRPVQRFAFGTQTAPTVSGFQVKLAGGAATAAQPEAADAKAASPGQQALVTDETAREVSPTSSIQIGFSAPMDQSDVERAFTIAPEADGDLSWSGRDLIFTPTERLALGGRYTISLVGSHDRIGNALGGKANVSFVVREGPQMVKTNPKQNAEGTEPAIVEMWFSHPMDVDATNAAFSLTDTATGALVAGRLNWNEEGTQMVYSPSVAFTGGRTFEVSLGSGATDADGNAIKATWSFTTKAPPVVVATPAPTPTARVTTPSPTPRPPAPAPAVMGASGLEGYALAQINNARAAYGKPPLVLDAGLSAAASAHAWDQLNRGYYAHSSRPGGYSAWGQNQCHHYAKGAKATMDWCHGVFMSEPYPGYPNHIGNILSTRYTRVGVGVADNGSRVVITWNFAN